MNTDGSLSCFIIFNFKLMLILWPFITYLYTMNPVVISIDIRNGIPSLINMLKMVLDDVIFSDAYELEATKI